MREADMLWPNSVSASPTASDPGGIKRSHMKCARPCSSLCRCTDALPSSSPRKTRFLLNTRTLMCDVTGTLSNSNVSFHAGVKLDARTDVLPRAPVALTRRRTNALQLDRRTRMSFPAEASRCSAAWRFRASMTRTTTRRITSLAARPLSVCSLYWPRRATAIPSRPALSALAAS